jgi:Ca2+-binding EF-hand superfamily protein
LGKEEFKKLDANKDGFLTLDEWKVAKLDPKEFARLDQTRSNRLSLSDFIKHKDFRDFKAKVKDVTGKIVAGVDTDKDGLLTREEFKAALQSGKIDPGSMGLTMTAFDLADRSLDGQLSPSELENLIAFSVAEAVLNKPPAPPSNPPAPPSNPATPPANPPSNPGTPPANPGGGEPRK